MWRTSVRHALRNAPVRARYLTSLGSLSSSFAKMAIKIAVGLGALEGYHQLRAANTSVPSGIADLKKDAKSAVRQAEHAVRDTGAAVADLKVSEIPGAAVAAAEGALHAIKNELGDNSSGNKTNEKAAQLQENVLDKAGEVKSKAGEMMDEVSGKTNEAKKIVSEHIDKVSKDKDDAKSTIQEKAGDVATLVSEKAQKVKGGVAEKGKQVIDDASGKAQDVKNNAQEAGDSIKDKVTTSKDQLKGKIENVKEGAKLAADEAKSKVEQVTENVKDRAGSKAKDTVEKVKDHTGEKVERVKEKVEKVKGSVAGNAKDAAEKGKASIGESAKSLDAGGQDAESRLAPDSAELTEGSPDADDQQAGAYNPETGEINWDCPCLGGMANGTCGEEFKEAFACFVYSEAEPKGIDCIKKFEVMRTCFKEHPEEYKEELYADDDDESSAGAPAENAEAGQETLTKPEK